MTPIECTSFYTKQWHKSVSEKKLAKTQLIHEEQMFIYFNGYLENKRHRWKQDNSLFKSIENVWICAKRLWQLLRAKFKLSRVLKIKKR